MMFLGSLNVQRTVRSACAAGLLLLFAACASTGAVKKDEAPGNVFADLPAGALAYVWIDVKPSRALLDNILARYRLNTKTIKTFFDRTDTATAAVYPAAGRNPDVGERRFLLVANGTNYPTLFSSFSFFFSPAWKKTRSVTGKKYWRSVKNRLSLFMQKNRTHISDADPFFIEEYAEAPENFAPFSADTNVSAWITGPDILNNALSRMDIPIMVPATALFIGASKHEEVWQAIFRLETPSPAQARGLVSVLNLTRNALAEGYTVNPEIADTARLLLSQPPYIDGNALILRCPAISEAALSGLIASFLIQLNR